MSFKYYSDLKKLSELDFAVNPTSEQERSLFIFLFKLSIALENPQL